MNRMATEAVQNHDLSLTPTSSLEVACNRSLRHQDCAACGPQRWLSKRAPKDIRKLDNTVMIERTIIRTRSESTHGYKTFTIIM